MARGFYHSLALVSWAQEIRICLANLFSRTFIQRLIFSESRIFEVSVKSIDEKLHKKYFDVVKMAWGFYRSLVFVSWAQEVQVTVIV